MELNIRPTAQFIKVSDTSISITKPVEPVTTIYNRKDIERQIIDTQESINIRTTKLAELQSILDQMDGLGVVSKINEMEVDNGLAETITE